MNKINQILNVSSREWPRIIVAWSMMFLTRFGFIVGWSVLIATFLSTIGIQLLPTLFLANALLVMLGALFFHKFIHKVRRELLITIIIISATAFLLSSVFFMQTNSLLFFSLLLISESVLLAQLSILLSLFNEELFTPLESQRTFPIIESAETIGGIMGGLALSLFAESIPAYKFIIIWALALLLILPIVLRFNAKTMDIPKLEDEEKVKKKKFSESFKELRKVPYLKLLMIVVLLHWGMMNVIEFQYTKAIQQEVYSAHEETLVTQNENSDVQLASIAEMTDQSMIYEQEVAKKLGTLHVLFNSAALFIQLILASRIITSIGVISTMLLHPLLTLLNLVGLTLRFSFFTAVLTRGSYELTSLLFKNGYDSSYYVIPYHQRDDVKELLQGVMKPIGAVIGTASIMILAWNFSGIQETLSLNVLLLVMGISMTFVLYKLSRRYTEMCEQNLSKKLDLATRLNAVEILAQNGHKKKTPALLKILSRENEPEILKRGILHTLGDNQDIGTIGSVLEALNNEHDSIRLAAIRALGKFEKLKANLMNQSFTKHRVVETLKDRLDHETDETITEELVRTFHKIAPEELTRFLLESIKNNGKQTHEFIKMLRIFEDPNLIYYLEPYLEDEDRKLRAASIIALWQFKKMRTKLRHYLKQMLESKSKSTIISGIETCGKINELKSEIKFLLKNSDNDIHEAAILALAQMEDETVIPHLVLRFANPNHHWFNKAYSILGGFPKKFKHSVKNALNVHISDEINMILAKHKTLSEIENSTLHYLRDLYKSIGAHHEVKKIEMALDSSD